MKLYSLHREQKLPINLDKAWEFFSNPCNLEIITPPWLNLKPASLVPEQMYPGMIVVYGLKPFPGLQTNWVTEITHVSRPYFFVDEQRFGPYKFWHHQHHFREIRGGVVAKDLIHYALPAGPLGRFVHAAVVRKQLEKIFEYRRRALEEQFPSPGRVSV